MSESLDDFKKCVNSLFKGKHPNRLDLMRQVFNYRELEIKTLKESCEDVGKDFWRMDKLFEECVKEKKVMKDELDSANWAHLVTLKDLAKAQEDNKKLRASVRFPLSFSKEKAYQTAGNMDHHIIWQIRQHCGETLKEIDNSKGK